MQSVLTADGTVASATSDMLIPLHMLGRPSFILENSLMLLMFQSIPCSIPNLSGADLKDTINATKSLSPQELLPWMVVRQSLSVKMVKKKWREHPHPQVDKAE